MSKILEDGLPTKVGFTLRPGVKIEMVTVKPFGVDVGDPNVMTNMNNIEYRTMAPKKLKTVTRIEGTCNYDPDCMYDIFYMAGKNQELICYYSDGDRWKIWGYLRSWEPQEHKEGEKPTANFVIEPTNRNNSGAETGPVKL